MRHAKEIHVLLVEDNPGDARLVRELLTEAEDGAFAVDTVERLDTALAQIEEKDNDVMLLDLFLPDAQGLETFRLARQGAPSLPIVVLTGLDDRELALELVREGAEDYVVKGQLTGESLARAMRYAIQRHRLTEELLQAYTRLRENERQFALLARASATFDEASLDLQSVLHTILELVSTELDDYCVIRLLAADGHATQEVAFHAADPVIQSDLDAYFSSSSVTAAAPVSHQVIATGQSLLIPDVTENPALLGENLAFEQWLGPHTKSVLIVPLQARGQVIGTLAVVRGLDGARYAAADKILLENLAGRAALAIENARLLDAERQARSEAEAATTVRDRVLATVAHDLRNPLAAINAYSQVIQLLASDPASIDRTRLLGFARNIGNAADRMAEQINELLDIGRIQLGYRLTLNRTPTDIVALANHIAIEYQQNRSEHVITIETPPESIVGNWDELRLIRVLDNLVGNAVKYSPGGGTITVRVSTRAEAEGDFACVQVEDKGLGIPPDDLPHIFEAFHRAHNVGTTPGTGLGLMAVHHIVEEHGGSINVSSIEGAGSCFTVTLPLRYPAE